MLTNCHGEIICNTKGEQREGGFIILVHMAGWLWHVHCAMYMGVFHHTHAPACGSTSSFIYKTGWSSTVRTISWKLIMRRPKLLFSTQQGNMTLCQSCTSKRYNFPKQSALASQHWLYMSEGLLPHVDVEKTETLGGKQNWNAGCLQQTSKMYTWDGCGSVVARADQGTGSTTGASPKMCLLCCFGRRVF